MTKDELIQQNEALVQLVQDSQGNWLDQNAVLLLIVIGVAGTLAGWWFTKINKNVVLVADKLTELDKDKIIQDYKLEALGETTKELYKENEKASIELKKSMSSMSKEMTKLADTQVEVWTAVKENKLNIQNLQAANKFITENYNSSMQELTGIIKKAFKIKIDAA